MSCEPAGQRRYRNVMGLVLTLACVFCVYYALDIRASAKAMRAELERYKAANENAVLVMASIRDRAALARDLRHWFDALVTLDGMATLARMMDNKMLVEQFALEFNRTIEAAHAARKAKEHVSPQSSIEGSGDCGPEPGEGCRRSAA